MEDASYASIRAQILASSSSESHARQSINRDIAQISVSSPLTAHQFASGDNFICDKQRRNGRIIDHFSGKSLSSFLLSLQLLSLKSAMQSTNWIKQTLFLQCPPRPLFSWSLLLENGSCTVQQHEDLVCSWSSELQGCWGDWIID